jgi:hypothetical protein
MKFMYVCTKIYASLLANYVISLEENIGLLNDDSLLNI